MGSITLTSGRWKAWIAPDFGMNTVALTLDGEPVLRAPGSAGALAEDPCVYGIPLLLPPNRTAHGRFSFDGVTYSLPVNEPNLDNHLHGYLCRSAFTVTEKTAERLSAEYRNDGEVFPFPFVLRTVYELGRSGYSQCFTFENTAGTDMPLTFGLHTAFLERGPLRVPVGSRWETDASCIPTGRLLEPTAEEASWRSGIVPGGRKIRGFFTAAGHTAQIGRICYCVSRQFDQWVLWNGDGKQGFLCVEPLCGAVNALNSGSGLLRLRPGQSVRFSTRIHLAAAVR